jgi:hypothetical protein
MIVVAEIQREFGERMKSSNPWRKLAIKAGPLLALLAVVIALAVAFKPQIINMLEGYSEGQCGGIDQKSDRPCGYDEMRYDYNN